MKINRQDLNFCIGKARDISHAYDLKVFGGEPKRSIDLTLEICTASCGLPIEVWKDDSEHDNQLIKGACVLSPTKAEILISHHLNHCWTRFTVCKELFHVVLDRDEYRGMDIFKHIEEILLSFPDDDSTPEAPVACEFLAEVAAMEFLLPYSVRESYLQSGNMNAMGIAKLYEIPCMMVERYMSPQFMENLKV